MNQWLFDTLEAFIATLVKTRDTLLLRKPAEAVLPISNVTMQPTKDFYIFLGFIRGYEGANPANNNPYDFKYYPGGYLPKYGVVRESTGGFAMFETLVLGELYGETCITEMIENHPEWTFLDFFNRFSPANDNNDPVTYSTKAAANFGVENSANLKSTLKM
jgi:hypothetical protein